MLPRKWGVWVCEWVRTNLKTERFSHTTSCTILSFVRFDINVPGESVAFVQVDLSVACIVLLTTPQILEKKTV